MMNLTITRDCRVWTSKANELDLRVKLPLRIHSPVTGKTSICEDRCALAAFLQAHVDAIPCCFYTVEMLMCWLTDQDEQVRTAVSRHDYQVRQMIDPACIYL